MGRKPGERHRHVADWGGNWIRPEKRLAIYDRDGWRCIYCLKELSDLMEMTLDHIRPPKDGGSNEPRNLVTACKTCNSVRADYTIEEFIIWLWKKRGQKPSEVRKRLARAKHKKIVIIKKEDRK